MPTAAPVESRTIEIHRTDVRVKGVLTNTTSPVGGGTRSRISSFSDASRRRLLFQARNLCEFLGMVTFTYPADHYATEATGGNFMTDGRAVKEMWRRTRQWLTRKGVGGIWFLEFQARGAPHFHVLTNRPLTPQESYDLRKYWAKLVGSKCPYHRTMGVKAETLRSPHAAGMYAAKYSAKSDQKEIPPAFEQVGRFWGKFGIKPADPVRLSFSWKELHTLIRLARKAENVNRRARGIPKRRCGGQPSVTRFDVGPVLLSYLARTDTLPDSPQRIDVTVRTKPTPVALHP